MIDLFTQIERFQKRRAAQSAERAEITKKMKHKRTLVELTLPISGQKVPAWIIREGKRRTEFMLESGRRLHLLTDRVTFIRIRG